MVYVWALVAALFAVTGEVLMRRYGWAPWMVSFSVMVSVFLGLVIPKAPSFVQALTMYSMMTLGLRIVATLVIFRGELSWKTGAALGLLVIASFLKS